MTPDQWQRVSELFHAALELDEARRAAFLEDACADAPRLREDVESLIDALKKARNFLAQPALEMVARQLGEQAPQELIGKKKAK